MMANTMYPVDTSFVNNILHEVRDNFSRLQHHPSIVAWCGNNEIDVAWHNWGWQNQYEISSKHEELLKGQYDALFMDKIPTLLYAIDPNAQYMHTSPLSNWGIAENFNHGSMHNWGVYHGPDSFDSYATNVGRFNSEYGFQSFPNPHLIKEYFGIKSKKLKDPLLSSRQKSYKGNLPIYTQLSRYYPSPKNLTELSYLSQLTQAKGMTYAIQNHRLQSPRCMGSLFWQLNDCWPAISWSAIDTDGQWRAIMYEVKRAYNEVAAFIDTTDNKLNLVVLNDLSEPVSLDGLVTVYNSKGALKTEHLQGIVPAHDRNSYPIGKVKDNGAEYIRVKIITGENASEFTHKLVPETQLTLKEPELRFQWSETDKGLEVSIIADAFVKDLYLYNVLEGKFLRNFIDLYPGEEQQIIIETDQSLKTFSTQMNHISLNHVLGENH